MAGAGYKLFNTGDVLTAAQVNTYLQEQVVMVFANAAARTTALSGVLAEGMVTYLKDTDALEIYSGSAWVGYGLGDITSVVAGTGLSGGGTSGDVTLNLSTPVSATNGGTAQTTYATGDLLYASASNTLAKRTIGTTGQVLTVSGGVPTWGTASGGMTVLSSGNLSGSNTITFSSISGSYNNLELHIPSYNLNGLTRPALRINNNTGANYFGFYIRNRASTASTGSYNAQTYINLDGEVTPQNDTNNGSIIIRLPSYTATDGRKVIEVAGHSNDGNVVSFYETFTYNGTQGAITRIDLITIGGQNFTAGSYILYGVK